MKEKLKSPVVWITFFTTTLAQLKILQDSKLNWITVSMAICTVAIAFFGALNNPDKKDCF